MGATSESALESRNKHNTEYRARFAFKGTIRQNIKDVGIRLLVTSDPHLFCSSM